MRLDANETQLGRQKDAVLVQSSQRTASLHSVSSSYILWLFQKTVSSRVCLQLLLPTSLWRVKKHIMPWSRSAQCWVTLEATQQENIAS